MDFTLDIIIQKIEIKKLDLTEYMIEWGNDIYSLEPPQYRSSTNLIFEQNMNFRYFNGLLERDVNDDVYIILSLKGEVLLNLQNIVNNQKEKIKSDVLINFLTELLCLNQFYIILIRDDEKIGKKYYVNNSVQLIEVICNSLNWCNPEDVLITK